MPTESLQNAVAETRELASLYSQFIDANVDLEESVARLQSIGHKFKNTNYPKPEQEHAKDAVKPPEGFVTDLNYQLQRVKVSNGKIREVLNKLEEII